MTWRLREIPNPWHGEPLPDGGGVPWEPGHCWKAPPLTPDSIVSPEWRASGRDDFIWIVIPGGQLFCPDRISSNGVSGWTVTGELPNITISPSIGATVYHGWCQNGVLSDDLEGRQYPDEWAPA